MDFRDISKMRVTVRRFSQKPVEKEKLDLILEAGRWSPTAVDYQPQRVLVLNTPESLDKVRQFCTFGYDKRYVDIAEECDAGDAKHNVYYYGAPLVLPKDGDRFDEPKTMTVAELDSGRIHLMPMPEKGVSNRRNQCP